MNCEQLEKISLLIDGELSTTETREVERHLVGCGVCQMARAEFLKLRSQIGDFSLLSEPLAPRPALARILSQSGATPVQPSLRSRLFGAFVPRFNPPLAAFAALLLIAITIGAVAFLGYRKPGEIASKDQAPQPNEQAAAHSQGPKVPSTIDSHDEVADSRGRKPSRVQPRETTTNPRKPNSRIKPTRERSAPPPSLPQTRNQAPPTYAGVNERGVPVGRPLARAADTETLTMQHMEQSELLLRAFRNVRLPKKGAGVEVAYERKRARQLVYQNILLRREADTAGDVQVATLLNSLEPILLDIANLRDKPGQDELRAIRERVERKSLVALLQINSSALARAND